MTTTPGSRRRVALAVASVLGAAVLVVLALSLAHTQRDARRTVESRFAEGSEAAAALVQTIVAQAYTNDVAIARRRLAAAHPRASDIQRAATRLNVRGFVVLDRGGLPIVRFPSGAPLPPITGAHVRQALAGRPAISGALPSRGGAVIEVAVPFPASGGRRVLLVPATVAAVQTGLGPYLRNLPGLDGHRTYIAGPRGETLSDSDARAPRDAALPAALRAVDRSANVAYDGARRQLSSSAIGGTPWRMVDTVTTTVLYSPVNGWRRALPWVVLLLLLPAGAVLVFLAERAARSADRARQASEAKSAFMASMSHELRTPMTTVIGFSEMLHEGKLGEVSERQQEVLGHVVTSSRHLNQLISEILDLSRVEEGRMTFTPQDVQPHVLVGEVVASMRAMADDRGIRLDADAPDCGTFSLDPGRFKQVLYNLIGNAIKFSEAGGHVAIRLSRPAEGEVAIEVRDDGPGVPPEEVERIFLPFEQGSHRNGGAGLGLAVSRRIVDAQGGRIDVDSAPGAGATFTVTLPPAS